MADNKIKVGQISIVIILVLAIFSNLYEVLGLSIRGVGQIIIIINDASAFFDIICICFFVISVLPKYKKYPLAILCAINIILVNRLYSNKKWAAIVEGVRELIGKIDVEITIFWVLVGLLGCYIMYKYIKGRSKAENSPNVEDASENINDPKENELKAMSGEFSVANGINQQVNRDDQIVELKIINETETGDMSGADIQIITDNEKNASCENRSRIPLPIICSFAVIIFILLYYGGLKLKDRGIDIPNFIPMPPTVLYCLALFSATIILCYIIVVIFGYAFKQLRQRNNSFRISAIIAVILETALLLNSDKIDAVKLTNRFISAITENWFTSLLAIIILFLILQIVCIIGGHVFFENSDAGSHKLIEIMRSSMERIEHRMVKIAFNIIEGCIALFDFIPDFFTTIGYVLLEKDIVIGNKDEKDKEDEADKVNKDKKTMITECQRKSEELESGQ